MRVVPMRGTEPHHQAIKPKLEHGKPRWPCVQIPVLLLPASGLETLCDEAGCTREQLLQASLSLSEAPKVSLLELSSCECSANVLNSGRSGLKVVSSLRVSSAQMSHNDGPAIQYAWLPAWVESWKASLAFPDKNAVYTGGAAMRVAVTRKTALLSKRQKIAIIIVLIAIVGGFLFWYLVLRGDPK